MGALSNAVSKSTGYVLTETIVKTHIYIGEDTTECVGE